MRYEIKDHGQVCQAENDPKHYNDHVEPFVLCFECSSDEVSKTNCRQGDKTVVEAIKKNPVFNKNEYKCRDYKENKKPRH